MESTSWRVERARVALGIFLAVSLLLIAAAWERASRDAVQSNNYGDMAHAFYSASEGRGFYSAVAGGDLLARHASPILYALLPVYMVFPAGFTLLVLCALAVALAASMLWWMARRRLGSWPSLGLVLLYVLHPATASLAYAPTEVVFAQPFLLWMLVGVDRRRWSWVVLGAAGAVACKENIALLTATLGLWLLLEPQGPIASRLRPRAEPSSGVYAWHQGAVGLGLLVLSLLWMLVVVQVWIPLFGGDHGGDALWRYQALGEGWSGLLAAPFSRPALFWGTLFEPERLAYLGALFGAFAFLPLLSPTRALVATGILLQNLLSEQSVMRAMQDHYDGAALPVLAWASVHGAQALRQRLVEPLLLRGRARWPRRFRMRGRAPEGLLAAWVFLALGVLFAVGVILPGRGRGYVDPVADHTLLTADPSYVAELRAIRRAIPPGVSVASPVYVQPRLSRRPESAFYRPKYPPPADWLARVDAVVVPRRAPFRVRESGPFSLAAFPGHRLALSTRHFALLHRVGAPFDSATSRAEGR